MGVMRELKPDSVKILGAKLPVDFLDGMEDCGYWDGEAFRIGVSSEIPPESQKITLLHEVIHVMDEFLHLKLSHGAVYTLSQAIFALMRENPSVVHWVRSTDD